MDISSLSSLTVANKAKVNDNDGDDKSGVKASRNNVAAHEVAASNEQNTGNIKPATPTAKSGEDDNVIQTKTPQGSKQGNVDVLA